MSIRGSERSALEKIAGDPVSRRRFLTVSGAGSGAGILLAACGGGQRFGLEHRKRRAVDDDA